MGLKNVIEEFFSDEAGQERRAWLSGKEEQFGNALSYALGPDLAPRVNALANVGAMISPGADVIEARQAGSDMFAPDRSALDRAGSAAAMVGAGAMMLMPGGASSVRQGVDSLVDAGMRAYDPSQVNMFAGRNAATADTEALARAEEMLEGGASRDDVLRDTGWFRGVDGKMRFEIDDSGAFPFVKSREGVLENGSGQFGDIILHDELQEAYPDVANIDTIYHNSSPRGGQYQPFVDRSGMDLFDIQEEIGINDTKPFGLLRTALHEGQHAIQRREGFVSGSSPSRGMEMARDRVRISADASYDNMTNLVAKLNDEERQEFLRFTQDPDAPFRRDHFRGLSSATRKVVDASDESLKIRASEGNLTFDNAQAFYRRVAGEVEARNVEARREFTPQQRRDIPPWATADVAESAQILPPGSGRSNSLESDTAYSVPPTTRAQALPPLAPELAFMKDIYR